MDDEELALLFSARKENEELKEKIERLTANMNSIVVEMGKMEDYRQILDSDIVDRDKDIQTLKSFIIWLDKYPKFLSLDSKVCSRVVPVR